MGWNGERYNGNGNVRTETRNVGDFHGVRTSGSIDVEISNGESFSVSVEDDDNILPIIVTDVKNGILNVHYKDNTSISDDHAKVYVKTPSLDKIVASGSANMILNDVLKSDRAIEVSVSGSGDIRGGLDAPKISTSIGGSGNITLHGRTRDFEGHVSGSGDLKCSDLQSENADVSVSGSGKCACFRECKFKGESKWKRRYILPRQSIHT